MDGEHALLEHYEASNRRDYSAAMSYYDEEVVAVSFGDGVNAGVFRGIEAVGRMFGDWMSTFAGGVVFDDIVIERGRDALAMKARMTARGRESGVELTQDWAWAYWMRCGKIVRVEIHTSFESARAAAGAGPS